MPASLTLGGVQLNANMIWQDRHISQSVVQTAQRTLGGKVVLYSKPVQAGKFITLVANEDSGWLTRQQMLDVKALADVPGGTYQLVVNGTESYTVVFRHQEAPAFEVSPLVPRLNEHEPGVQEDYYVATIKLMTV